MNSGSIHVYNYVLMMIVLHMIIFETHSQSQEVVKIMIALLHKRLVSNVPLEHPTTIKPLI